MTGGALRGGAVRAVAAAVLAVLAVCTGAAAPAYAHTELDDSVPAPGARLQQAPGSIQVTFTEPVDAELATVVVRGPNGEDLAVGGPRALGSGLIQPMAAPTEAGRVEVAYRVVSLDGHPVSGSFGFAVSQPAPSSASPSAAPTGTPTGTPTPAPTSTPTSTQTDQVLPGGGSDDAGGTGTTMVLGGGVALVALLVALGALGARRRRADGPRPTPHPTTPAS